MAKGSSKLKDDSVFLTKEGFKKLKAELQELETVKRKEVALRLKQAIEYGDLSENSEYEEAKNEQAFIEGRIIELKKKIKNAKIIQERYTGAKTVQIGVRVVVKNLTDDEEAETYTIVGSTEADPVKQKISNESPIGEALIGKTKGEVISVRVPAGMYEYKIMDVK